MRARCQRQPKTDQAESSDTRTTWERTHTGVVSRQAVTKAPGRHELSAVFKSSREIGWELHFHGRALLGQHDPQAAVVQTLARSCDLPRQVIRPKWP
jgi:hypothetical protein